MKENNQIIKIPSNRLSSFPIMMFTIIMGLSGITIVYQKAHVILGLSAYIGTTLAYITIIFFSIILLLYFLKTYFYFNEVKKEFSHSIRINFFATTSISFLLVSIVFSEISESLSIYFFYIGTFLQTFFTFYTISFWINNNLEIQHSNPSWFIPIVGNVLVPVAGAGIINNNFLMYYFSIGIFFWLILTAILLNRIIFHNQLIIKFIPTLFIFIAPPSISFIAYIKMFNEINFFAIFLYDLGLFFSFLLFFMFKNFINLKFFISWWAFTFPLSSIAIASILFYEKSHFITYLYFSYLFIFITTIVIAFVSFKTVKHIINKEICIQE